MRSITKATLILLLSLATLGVEARSPKGAGLISNAIIAVDKEEHNFGDKRRKEGDIHNTFTIHNCGSEPLVITNVITSCSCIKTHYSRRPIPVGGQCSFKVTYELKKMPLGSFSKSLLIYSNTKSGEALKLTVSGHSH